MRLRNRSRSRSRRWLSLACLSSTLRDCTARSTVSSKVTVATLSDELIAVVIIRGDDAL